MSRIPTSFFTRTDTTLIAKELLGKVLVTDFGAGLTAGKIVETEAYLGPEDKACHAYGFKRTKRTEIMFWEGGTAYVYLIYGMHHLFNVVTHEEGMPHAVLIRGLEPLEGTELMLERRNMKQLLPKITAGPGSLSKAMGIRTEHTGLDLSKGEIWVEDRGEKVPPSSIIASPRVGVGYAEDHALWPLRFRIKDNPWTSPAK